MRKHQIHTKISKERWEQICLIMDSDGMIELTFRDPSRPDDEVELLIEKE